MSINYENEINTVKERLEKARETRIRAEARLEQLGRQKQEIHEEFVGLGVSPGKLDSEISRLEKEIEGLLKKIDEILPQETIM